jgi:TolB-like protein/tetratricopeptide (TPR) repeat protein
LLQYLADHPNRIVGKDELFSGVWDRTVVTDDTLTQSIKDLRRVLGDADGKLIRTFPKRGYMLCLAEGDAAPSTDGTGSAGDRLGARPAIAVLPFLQMAAQEDQRYFADGMAEDLITGLSRIPWLLVIARNTSFRLREIHSDPVEAARQLSIRYLVEGSVRKTAGRIRLSIRLLDTTPGFSIWAGTFDGPLDGMFDLQDEITEKVVGIVEPRIQKAEIERSRRKHPGDMTAYDLYLRAVPHTATQMPDAARVAIDYLRKALAIDPAFASAHALLAWCHEWCFTRGGFHKLDKEAALEHARKALVSSTDDSTALAIAGFVVAMLDREYEAGLAANRRALEINHSCATAMYLGAITSAFAGRPHDAIALADRASRTSPLDILSYQAHFAKAIAAVTLDAPLDSLRDFDAAIQANPELSSLYFTAAAASFEAGCLEKARSLVQNGLAREPDFRLRLFEEVMAPEVGGRFAAAGRKLGLPM